MGKDAEIYDKAYIDGSDIWDNVKHKNIHQLMFGDLNERLERLRYLYCINKVLNLGSGDGQNIKFLMRKAASIDNWDISKSGIQKINKAYNGVSGVYAETVDLNLTENYNLAKYDYIEGIAILHHINTKEFIIKLAKEMKETAVAVFLEPGALNPPAIIARRLMRTNYHTDDEHPFLLWKFEKFLNGHFKNVEIYPYNIFSYGISYWLPQNRITELLVRALLFLETRLLLKLPLFQELCGNFIIVLKK